MSSAKGTGSDRVRYPVAVSKEHQVAALDCECGWVKSKTFDIQIEPLETDLSLNVPEKVFSGEEFDIKADYKAKKPENSPKLSFKIIYPDGFSKTADKLEEKDSTSGSFSAKGKVNLPDDASFEIKAQLTVNLMEKDYVVAERVYKVLLSP